ncbi:hypothetical protein MMC14_010091 [Varicellaria rhodocarpa]|nr:hypothetical protein [Varicellaria rhodocarpa]
MGSPYPSMISIRPPHDAYRSLPGTPLGVDPRAMAPTDISLAMNHARMGLDVPDYFSPDVGSMGQRFGSGMNPRSPFPNDIENERFGSSYGGGEASTPDMICSELIHRLYRINLAAQLVNGQISHSAKYGKVFPHLCDDGRYPSDFNLPKTVEVMKILDNSQLDRILQSYRLPQIPTTYHPSSSSSSSSHHHLHPSSSSHAHSSSSSALYCRDHRGGGGDTAVVVSSSSRARMAKLFALWEFLGAWRLVEGERLRRGL